MQNETGERDDLNVLMAQVRPRLHRYCARMMGSVFEGEDIVQEALAKAADALSVASPVDHPERWLFTIAHNTALDALRRRKRHADLPFDDELSDPQDSTTDVESWIATTASLATLMQLPVIQRSTVVLVDVLEYSLDETVDILDATLPAVKAALHRGRARLKTLAVSHANENVVVPEAELARLRAYAESFNARDFDALKNLLAEDVKLDLVNRLRLSGRKDVSEYFNRYEANADWEFSVGIAEGRAALLVRNPQSARDDVEYVVFLDWENGRISRIRDFRFARYIAEGLVYERDEDCRR